MDKYRKLLQANLRTGVWAKLAVRRDYFEELAQGQNLGRPSGLAVPTRVSRRMDPAWLPARRTFRSPQHRQSGA